MGAKPARRRRDGGVDIVVNNAGTCNHQPALEVTDEEWELVIDINLNGVRRCSRAFGRHMIANGGGVIVNIGSMSAEIVNRAQWPPAYNASTAAVHHLTPARTRRQRHEVACRGVGAARRARQRARAGLHQDRHGAGRRAEFRARWIDDAPMRRYALPDEYGPALVLLASDASSFMTARRS